MTNVRRFEQKLLQIYQLSDEQRTILQGLVAGDSNKEIGQQIGCSENQVRNKLLEIRRKLEVSTRAAAALYGYWLAVRGQPVTIPAPERDELEYSLGLFRCHAMAIAVDIDERHQVRAVLEEEPYQLPDRFKEQFKEWLQRTQRRCDEGHYDFHERGGANTLAVTRLQIHGRASRELTFTLKRVGYRTYAAIRDEMQLREAARLQRDVGVHPDKLQNPLIPLPLGVGVHIIVPGDPPELLVLKRGGKPELYPSHYGFGAGGFARADLDTETEGGTAFFSLSMAIGRKLREDRDLLSSEARDYAFKARMLGVVFDWTALTYNLICYSRLSKDHLSRMDENIDLSKGHYERIPLPDNKNKTRLDAICRSLLSDFWTPSAAIGVILYLRKVVKVQDKAIKEAFQRAVETKDVLEDMSARDGCCLLGGCRREL